MLGGCFGLRRGGFGLVWGCWACAGWVLGKWFWGFGVGQFGSVGWWVGFWASVGCVRAWGMGIWDWRGVDVGLGGQILGFGGLDMPGHQNRQPVKTRKKINSVAKHTNMSAKPTK